MNSDEDDEDMQMMRAKARERQLSALGVSASSSENGQPKPSIEALREKAKRTSQSTEQAREFFAETPAPSRKEPQVKEEKEDGDEEEEEEEAGGVEEASFPSEPEAVDESEVFAGFRAAFPVSFGKQEEKAVSLEAIHDGTRREGQKEEEKRRGKKKGGGAAKITFSVPTSIPGAASRGAAVKDESEREEGPAVIGPPRPPAQRGDGAVIGPPRPPPVKAEEGERDGEEEEEEEEEEDEDEEEEDEEEEDEYRIPMSNEIILKGHTRVASCVAVDPSGSRVLTGGYDYTLRMYDFQGMTSKLASFRQLEPSEGHQLRALSWSPSGDMFLAVTGSNQAKVYDRDGYSLGECAWGDMYLRDLRHTKGHIAGLTSGHWHPRERHTLLTASEDGSLRTWDVNNFKQHKHLVKPKLARPGRVSVTACCWGPEGTRVAAGLADGSLQIFSVRAGWGSRPELYVPKGHEANEDVTAVLFSADGHMLASRSTDDTLKLWDVRRFVSPLASFPSLPNAYPQTSLAWSPDERLLLTGTSTERRGAEGGGAGGGQLALLDKDRLALVRRVGVSQQAVVQVTWHPKINQIFATAGDKHQGGTHVLYDPRLSERGALSSVAKAPRQPRAEDFFLAAAPPVIHNPHALPLFRENPSRKRQREKARKDPLASKKPDLPMDGPGHGGRVGQSKGSLLTQYLLKGGLKKEIWMEEDPREAILKYAEAAAKDPRYIAPAYAGTQPKPVFDVPDEEEEE